MPNFCLWAHTNGRPSKKIAVLDNSYAYAVSEDLMRFQIYPGFSVERIKSLDHQCTFINRDLNVEQTFKEIVMTELYKSTPQIIEFGCSSRKLWIIAKNFKPKLFRATLNKFSAKGGYARTTQLSRLAAICACDGEFSIIRPEEEQNFLASYRTTDLAILGFSERTLDLLSVLGFRNLAMLSKLTCKQLKAQFGDDGYALHRFLNPGESQLAVPCWHAKQITITDELEWDYSESDFKQLIAEMINKLLLQKTEEITRISIKLNNIDRWLNQKDLRKPTRELNILVDCAFSLFRSMAIKLDEICFVELTVSLKEITTVQKDLWKNSEWESLKSTLFRRFPGRNFFPGPLRESFLPDGSKTLNPLNAN